MHDGDASCIGRRNVARLKSGGRECEGSCGGVGKTAQLPERGSPNSSSQNGRPELGSRGEPSCFRSPASARSPVLEVAFLAEVG